MMTSIILLATPGASLLLLILAVALVALVLHWLIGQAGKRALSRLSVAVPIGVGVQGGGGWTVYSMRRLLIEWLTKGIRTVLWLFFMVFFLAVLPHARDRFEGVSAKLKSRLVTLDEWILDRGLTALVILIVTIFLMRFAGAFIRTSFEIYEKRLAANGNDYLRRRARTLSATFRGIAQSAIFFVGFMVTLQQAGLNITPILASAGIIGIAIGFGAQSLIKDIFSGLLILLEDQYAVGDSIRIGDVMGTVEELSLRSTRVRAGDGALTTFPNGNIATVSNLSKDWLRTVVDFEIDYSSDIDRALDIMVMVAKQIQSERGAEVLEDPQVQGLEKVANGYLTLRVTVKTLPAHSAEIGRELRRRLKAAFDQVGIKGVRGPAV